MSDELSRLRDIEARLEGIVSEDREIRDYRRIHGTDALGAIVGVLDRTRREQDALLEDLIRLADLYMRALVKAQNAFERLAREALH